MGRAGFVSIDIRQKQSWIKSHTICSCCFVWQSCEMVQEDHKRLIVLLYTLCLIEETERDRERQSECKDVVPVVLWSCDREAGLWLGVVVLSQSSCMRFCF